MMVAHHIALLNIVHTAERNYKSTIMEAKEFVIKRFEAGNPEIVKVILEWTEFSITKNYDGVHIIINEYNVPNCPKENEYDVINEKGEHGNLQYYYLKKVIFQIKEYLSAQGYSNIHTLYPVTEISPNGKYINGFLIIAKL